MTTPDNKSTSVQLGSTGDAVADNIKRIRGEQGMSLRDLERALRENGHAIAHSGLSKIENRTRRVDVDDLMALSIALGVSPLSLLLPPGRGPLDWAELSGWGQDHSRSAWGFALGISELGDTPATEPGIVERSFPLWVEQMLQRWAAQRPAGPDDIFHPYGD